MTEVFKAEIDSEAMFEAMDAYNSAYTGVKIDDYFECVAKWYKAATGW